MLFDGPGVDGRVMLRCFEVVAFERCKGYLEANSRFMDVRGSENDFRDSSFDLRDYKVSNYL